MCNVYLQGIMLSFPDFKEKQVLVVVVERGSSPELKFQNDNFVFIQNGSIENRLSCHLIFSVFIVGDCSITSVLMRKAKEFGISLFFLKYNLETYARLYAPAEGNYLLRSVQYGLDASAHLDISKKIVLNKVKNQLFLLKKSGVWKEGLIRGDIKEKIMSASSLDSLRGVEGSVSREFFKVYFQDLGWIKRMPRTKIDEYNILLDIGYSFLFNFIDALLRLFGFDVYKGSYHQLFFQRKSLVCDIIEPFRCIIDKTLLKMHNLKQINSKDFRIKNGRYELRYDRSQKYISIFLKEILRYKEDVYQYIKGYYDFLQHGKEFPKFAIK